MIELKNDVILMSPSVFNKAIVGKIFLNEDEKETVVYSLSKILDVYVEDYSLDDHDEAYEFFLYNAESMFLSADDKRREGAEEQHPVLLWDIDLEDLQNSFNKENKNLDTPEDNKEEQ